MHSPEALPLPREEARAAPRRRSPHVRSHLPRRPHVPHVRHGAVRCAAGRRLQPTHGTVPLPIRRMAFHGLRLCNWVRRSGHRPVRQRRRRRPVSGAGHGRRHVQLRQLQQQQYGLHLRRLCGGGTPQVGQRRPQELVKVLFRFRLKLQIWSPEFHVYLVPILPKLNFSYFRTKRWYIYSFCVYEIWVDNEFWFWLVNGVINIKLLCYFNMCWYSKLTTLMKNKHEDDHMTHGTT